MKPDKLCCNFVIFNPNQCDPFLFDFCARLMSTADSPIFKKKFCLKDFEKFILKIIDHTS